MNQFAVRTNASLGESYSHSITRLAELDLLLHLGEAPEQGVEPLVFAEGTNRDTPIHFAAANDLAGKDAGLRADHGARLHAGVVAESDLAAEFRGFSPAWDESERRAWIESKLRMIVFLPK